MISEDFISRLTAKYKNKKDESLNETFYKDLSDFVDKCPESKLQEIYDYIPTFHTWTTPFNVWEIKQYAKKQGYIKAFKPREKDYLLYRKCNGFTIIEELEDEDGKKILKRHYHPCNTNYSFIASGCPNCHSTNSRVVKYDSDSFDPVVKLVMTKEDCHKCKYLLLDHKLNIENNVMGPECGEYGKCDSPDRTCGSCKCKVCCKDYKSFKADPRKYLHLQKLSRNDKRTWLSNSLVVCTHVRNDKRLSIPDKKAKRTYEKPDFFGVDIRKLAERKRFKTKEKEK